MSTSRTTAKSRSPHWLTQLLPFLRWFPLLNRQTLKADLLAGLTGAVVVLPQGVAFATIAGMPPEYGLYAGMIPAVVAALWGSSWHLVSGPTTAASIVVYSSLTMFAEPGSPQYVSLALTLTLMVGLTELAMGLARLGALVNFISHSVVVGFTAGAAILIASNQFKHFLGLPLPRGLHFHETLIAIVRQAGDINPYVTAVGVATLAAGLLVKRYAPKVPYMIAALLIGSLVAVLLTSLLGIDRTHITTVGALPATLPPLSWPDFSPKTWSQLAPAALATTLFALTEAVSISRSIAVRTGQHVDGSQEFIGQGLANMAGAFFSGFVSTGSFNRSGLNFQAGARTPLAAVAAGLLLMAVVVLVAPLAAYLPHAAMAAVLFLVAWGLIDFHHIERILKASRGDSAVLIVTFIATLTLELEFAILAGVLLSLGLYLNRTARPRIVTRVPDPRLPGRDFTTDPTLPECPQFRLIRVDGSLFFGAVGHVAEVLRAYENLHPSQHHLAIVAQGVNFADTAGAELLAQEAGRRHAKGGGVYLIRPKPGLLEPLRRGGFLAEIGEKNVFFGKTEAISHVVGRLDPQVCQRCTARIFLECSHRPAPSAP